MREANKIRFFLSFSGCVQRWRWWSSLSPFFFLLLLFYNNERNRTFFFFLSSYIFILCVQWVCIPPFPLAVDSLKLISSSVLSNVHTWWIGASHRRHCQSVDTLRSCVCVVLASLEGPLKGALPKRTLVMLLLHFFLFLKREISSFLFVGMWRALVSHLVVCCPPQQGQKSQQRLSIFYVERNYEEWGWWDPEGRSHKLRAYSGRHLRRSGVVWSRLEKKKEDSLRIVINGRTIKDNKLYGYRWGENIRPHMPPPFAIPIRLPSTSSFLCCASDLRKREAQWRILIVFFFFHPTVFFFVWRCRMY